MGQANGKEKGDAGGGMVDGGALVPQGVYSGAQDYNHSVVQKLIQTRKLAPFYTGLDDEEAYAKAPYNTECPICFLYYPSPLNHTRCCGQPICTECFVQIKRADPTTHNPPSSEPAMCPFCQESEFGIVYKAPSLGVLSGENGNIAGVAESASAARQQAEGSAEGSQQAQKKRKSFTPDDPSVVTIDAIRPDWQAKLMAAEAATLRRANRRIIMRQVGDRLIPVGVSSSRLGSDLPPGSTTGPGGAIIIGENERWGGDRRGTRGRRGGEIANFLQSLGGGPDMEEMMMMEAMRLSLLEHEEEQRRQAQSQSQEGQQNNDVQAASSLPDTANDGAPPTPTTDSRSAPAVSENASIFSSQQQAAPLPRSSSLATDSATTSTSPVSAPGRYTLNPQQLGISTNMMAELSELVEGGLNVGNAGEGNSGPTGSRAGASVTSNIPSSPAPQPPVAVPITPSTASSAVRTDSPATAQFSASPSFRRLQGLQEVDQSPSMTPPMSGTPPVGSPSRIGTNPNNPFRRKSAANSPTHSRQGSNANLGSSFGGANGSHHPFTS